MAAVPSSFSLCCEAAVDESHDVETKIPRKDAGGFVFTGVEAADFGFTVAAMGGAPVVDGASSSPPPLVAF
jgi:hypothetical protein